MSVVGVSQVQGRVTITIFKLSARINMGNVAELEQEARQAYDRGMRYLLLDLTDTPSITSAGLRALLVIYRMLEGDPEASAKSASEAPAAPRHSTHLKLLNPSPEVRRVLQIAGFDRYFESYVDLEKAVASF
jgi:anti-anti-sigma regulatory factor